MNKFWVLLKVQLKSTFNIRDLITSAKTNKKQLRKILMIVLLIVAIAPSYWLYNSLIQILFVSFAQINQQGVLIAAGITATGIIILFFGVMNIFSSFFGAKDLQMLLALPIKPKLIVASKLSGTIVAEYLFAIPLLLPIFINYGINIHAGFGFWIISAILTLSVPVIPLSIAAILSVLAVRAAGMRFDLEKIQLVFMLIFMAAVLTLNFTMTKTTSSIPSGSEQDFLAQMIADNHYLIDLMSSAYPPAKFAADAAVGYAGLAGVGNMLLFLIASAAAFFLAVLTGEKFYLGAVTRGLGGKNANKKSLTKEQLAESASRTSSKAVSIFKNDFRVLLRTPVYAINTLLLIPLLPVILIFTLTSTEQNAISALAELYTQFSAPILIFGCIAMVMITSLSNLTSSTFSREGSTFWINQVTPIRPIDHLFGRCMGAVLVNFLLIAALVLSFGILIHVNVISMIAMIIVATVATFPVMIGSLIVDLVHPYLNWTDPAKAVKQNINMLFAFLIALTYSAILAGLAFLMLSSDMSVGLILTAMVFVSGVASFLLGKLFLKIMPDKICFH